MKKAMFYGILASFFFAFTFLLNRSMNLSGGYWLWSAGLRYIFMLPMLGLLVAVSPGRSLRPVLAAIREKPWQWILWSTVGFGLFYLPLTLASVYGESWLTAASWQLTIVAGVLLTPLFGQKIPLKNLGMSCLILVGVLLLQLQNLSAGTGSGLVALIPITVAAFAYPLGNRKMMTVCPPEMDAIERVFGMTLCSIPFWIVACVVAYCNAGWPTGGQTVQSLAVALFSGVVATILFFHATDLVKGNQGRLAAVEATQCGEVVFTLLGGVLVLGDDLPTAAGFAGLALIVVGMAANSLLASGGGKERSE
ncbi:MAG: multidrug resistance efflux transporter family protein [Oscillospiraceae bacterium]|nr:multidrug resistance efflux transporter family protein [Oscillospiraceae bacterium]